MSIPKILHFTWKTKTLTKLAQRIWGQWEKTHPDWEMRLWDDDDIRALVVEHYPEQLAVFDAYPSGIFRADAFRFFVLHKFGGVYSDLDVEPLGDLNELIDNVDCFVGAEPEKHVRENDARYRGMPYLLCNAFMGSVPGHIYWKRCIDAMERCFCHDVIDATGPRFITGIGLTIPRDERPAVLSPEYWSPLAGHGRPWPTPPGFTDVIADKFDVIGAGGPAVVSHLWRNSWFMPIPYKGPSFWRIPNHLQWGLRRRRQREMADTRYKAPSTDYDNQIFHQPEPLPRLLLAVDASYGSLTPQFVEALGGLDYPRDRIAVAVFGVAAGEAAARLAGTGFYIAEHAAPAASADRHNAMLDAAKGFDGVVFADSRLDTLPPDALLKMVSAGRPIVGVNLRADDGMSRNESSFLYHRDVFKHIYRSVTAEGVVPPKSGRDRLPFNHYRYLNIAPLTAVGFDFAYIERGVIDAGLRFATTPYKYHLDVEAFCIEARDKGFEVCALPNVIATTTRPSRDR